MAAQSTKATRNHDKIRRWAEKRQGQPATVGATGDEENPGVLRLDFPGYSGEGSLEPITWDAFFEKFDEKNLVFLYQEKLASGEESRFFKLVDEDSIADDDNVQWED